MIIYCDTSALLKLYVSESESHSVKALVETASAVFTHEIAYIELMAAVAKAMRMGRIADAQLDPLLEDIEADWARFTVVGTQQKLVKRAGRLALESGLRGYDSLHLAAAEQVAIQLPEAIDMRFIVFDEKLRQAASRLGLAVDT